MINTLHIRRKSYDAEEHFHSNRLVFAAWVVGYMGIILLTARTIISSNVNPSLIAWLIFWSGIVVIAHTPRIGIYLIVGLTLAGDMAILPWYPFTKNMSSYESLMFLSNAAIISPAEVFMTFTLGAWLIRPLFRRIFDWCGGALFVPMAVFSGSIVLSLGYGLVRGGDPTIALWETRAILYIPLMYLLVVNLIRTPAQIQAVIWAAMLGVIAKAIAGLWYVGTVLQFDLSSVERIAEHPASIHFNALIVMAMATWVYRSSAVQRLVLTSALPIAIFSLFANQRRASFVALGIAILLIALVLFRERRFSFFIIVPIATLFLAVYAAAFWNSTTPIAMPARAIKSVISADESNARDQASNMYRILENINTMATIRSAPIMGVGFGNKFLIVVSMADISTFVWWEYITHNSIMWIWMKAGLFGFAAMIFLIGSALMLGAQAIWRLPNNGMGAIALGSTLYLMMHFTFAYVDMSWSIQSMVYVGTSMGILSILELTVKNHKPRHVARWPWQPVPAAPLPLRD
ncbi:MAG: O-antigen ligase family protein [Blastochloris sp.]|nr:O-antigen ligase family protein [Blastochloris sp.]